MLSDKSIDINSDDIELIETIKNGNDQAFNYLVLKYQKRVYWVIRKMVSDHDDADDITQEVFIRVYKSINDFRGDSSFFTYLYRVAVNLSLNHLNRMKKILSRKGDFETETMKYPSNERPVEKLMDDKRNEKLLKDAIEKLPAQQKAVFILRFYEELPYEEIAKIMKRSTGGLKANYFHAIKKLQTILKPHFKDLTEAI